MSNTTGDFKVIGVNLSNTEGNGGFSIEDPCLFTYGGRWYYFTAMISNPDKSVEPQNLDNKHLELFEYTNEINSLCLFGRIIYKDLDGSISRFFNRMDNHIEVSIWQLEKVSEGSSLEQFVPCGRPNNSDHFVHTFIVQNIGVLKREHQAVTYDIRLVSALWYSLSSKLVFSNYPLELPDSDDVPKNGFRMIQKFLSDVLINNPDIKIDEESFKKAIDASQSKIQFITNGNETVFTAIPYILETLYWHFKQKENSLKFIVYDPVTWTYKCIDYNDTTTWNECIKPVIFMSVFETNYEQSLFSVNNELGAVIGKPQTQTYEDLFEHRIYKFDPKTNDFKFSDYSFKTKSLAEMYNNRPDTFKTDENGEKTEDKYQPELNADWFKNKDTYRCETSLWNRDFLIYQSMISNLMKRDAWIINTEGDVTHQPGACMGIVLDRTIEKVPELTAKEREELCKKFRQMEGLFPILKVRHMYKLATHPGSDASYTENVVLGRNFILPPAKPISVGALIKKAMGALVSLCAKK